MNMNPFQPTSVETQETKEMINTKKKTKRIICYIVLVFILIVTPFIGSSIMRSNFENRKNLQVSEIRSYAYNAAYEHNEKEYHVTNDVQISIGKLQTESKLEVLKVYDIEYEIYNDTNALGGNTIWLEVPGKGTYTVDLSISEFIADAARHYILVRVPKPKITQFSLDYANIVPLLADKSGFTRITDYSSYEYGIELAQQQLETASQEIQDELNANTKYYESAKTNTKTILEHLVKQVNPLIPDLIVEVEFID